MPDRPIQFKDEGAIKDVDNWRRATETLHSMCTGQLMGEGPTPRAFISNLRLYASGMEKYLHPEVHPTTCVLDGSPGEDPDDCTTHEHEGVICRTCGASYEEAGDGWDGECPDCADKTETERNESNE